MLNGIDEIDWSRLSHAYGPADDVPAQLRALASADPAVRDRARHDLYGNIFHQGTRYEATAYAVPFLLELLADPATAEPSELLALLVALAIEDDGTWLPDNLPVAELRRVAVGGAALLAAAPHPGDPEFDEDEGDYVYVGSLSRADQERLYAHITLAAYDAVRAGVPLFRQLLTRPDPALRAGAAHALAWFPEDAAGSVPALAALIEAAPSGATSGAAQAAAVGTAAVALGLLGVAPDSALLTDARPVIRWGAAVGRARVLGPTADPATIDELMTWAGGRGESAEGVPFLDGDLAGHAGLALRQLGADHAGAGFEVLLGRIPTVSGTEALPVVAQALTMAFPDGPLPAGTPATDLTDRQRRLVETLAGSPGSWRIGAHTFGNFSQLVASRGLPGDPAKLRAYLDDGSAPPR
ncbi:hypothetical protein GA0070216_11982 [Micromonospora matsumotoense]|uniref:HEAT repeat-containing protein n=1 Tax=Micromonospora matsumotoense TaxID=121616 RepID=A0A1C5AM73_9ACTN|nr:hypothetical protein [Micromonospora matsumotoense]SCF46181.1 hypothetical protein GA0070216_11982 [Micromonospora matsumotoense]